MKQPLVSLLCLAALALPACAPDDWSDPAPISAEEVAERIDPILALDDPVERLFQTSALLARAPQEAQPALQAAFERAQPQKGAPELVAFLMWWADFKPPLALAWALGDWTEPDPVAIAAIFGVWASDEPLRAFNMLETLPGDLGPMATAAVIDGWQRSGQPGLLERVQSINDMAARQRISETLAKGIVADLGAAKAIEWAQNIENPNFRHMFMLRIASSAANQGQAELVSEWATELVTEGNARPSGMPRRIGTRWIKSDPEAALAWLSGLPAGKDRDDGVMESFRDWMLRDEEKATAWAEAAEIERWNEPAFSIYLRHLGQEDPQQAITRLAEFEDVRLRARMMKLVARRWLREDPAPAAAWLKQAEVIPPGMRRTLAAWIATAEEEAAQTAGGEAGSQVSADADS